MLPHDHPGSYAIINRDWRYIYYQDGSEELYDLTADFHEWNNVAGDVEFEDVKNRLKDRAPSVFAPQGTPKKNLRMVTEENSFHWVPKAN